MDTSKDPSKIFDELVELHKNYALIHRRAVSFDKYSVLMETAVDQPRVLESLLEHVGSLPIVATFLHPHLEHRDKIDLGRVLTMVAIHDIGETIVGDAHSHRKTQEHVESEHAAALSLLHKNYHHMFDEYEAWESLDAKFAKAVDVFATFLTDQLLPPAMVQARFKTHDFSWQEIEEKRYKVFAWDAFLKKMFAEVTKRYKIIVSK